MKLLLLPLVLVSMSIGARQEPAVAAKEGAGKLEIERGFVSSREGWYQDKFGLARQSAKERTEMLDLTIDHKGTDTVIVEIESRMESGIDLVLHFRYDGERVVECTATGHWRYDFGSKPSDFAGALEDVSGFVRIGSLEPERRKLVCLFAIHGLSTRGHKDGDPPDLVMGGFEIDDPFGQPKQK